MNENEPDMIYGQWDRLRRAIVAVLVVILVAVWLVWGPVEPICYVGGLFNSMYVWVLMLYLSLLIVPAIVFFPALVVYTPITWHRQTPRARRRLVLLTLAAGGLVVPTVVGFTGLTASPFDLYVRGFAKYAERRADVDAMRNWLSTLNLNEYILGEHGTAKKQFSESEQPPCIARLHPKRTVVGLDDTKHLTVTLLWGGGLLGHWGIVVGLTDMPTPPSDASKFGVHRFPLASGAYVWSSE